MLITRQYDMATPDHGWIDGAQFICFVRLCLEKGLRRPMNDERTCTVIPRPRLEHGLCTGAARIAPNSEAIQA